MKIATYVAFPMITRLFLLISERDVRRRSTIERITAKRKLDDAHDQAGSGDLLDTSRCVTKREVQETKETRWK